MNSEQAKSKLHLISQEHLLEGVEDLSEGKQQQLFKQIANIDIPTFRKQQQLVLARGRHAHPYLQPARPHKTERETCKVGQQVICEGKVGCLVVCGGRGTRLGHFGPKGTYQIRDKSLFEYVIDRVKRMSTQCSHPLQIALMTSPDNHEETTQFFVSHNYFGLSREQVHFFQQGMLPLLNRVGDLFLQAKGEIAEGPNGNGEALAKFYQSGIWEKWYQQGVRFVNFLPIDNLLADPFDLSLVGMHVSESVEVVVKCIKRVDPKEQVGLLARENHHIRVVEYSEVDPKKREAVDRKGKLIYSLANISLFSFSMDFIRSVAKKNLPLHLAYKPCKMLHAQSLDAHAWKFETFIFDVLEYATLVRLQLFEREKVFAPLKKVSDVSCVEKSLDLYLRNNLCEGE